MKEKLLFAVLLGLMISGIASAQNKTTHDSVIISREEAQTDTLVFTVYGMDCPGCEVGLEKQVNKIASVSYADADWLKQELRIVMVRDSSLNESELEKRVKKANFTLEKEEK